jgi:hypothetical protein
VPEADLPICAAPYALGQDDAPGTLKSKSHRDGEGADVRFGIRPRRLHEQHDSCELAISQPAVSKAIADMEHALGVRLLDRTPLGVERTPYGDALVKWALAVFDDLRQGVREIAVLSDSAVGEVRIGSVESPTAERAREQGTVELAGPPPKRPFRELLSISWIGLSE